MNKNVKDFRSELWPMTFKINRVLPYVMTNQCMKFNEDSIKKGTPLWYGLYTRNKRPKRPLSSSVYYTHYVFIRRSSICCFLLKQHVDTFKIRWPIVISCCLVCTLCTFLTSLATDAQNLRKLLKCCIVHYRQFSVVILRMVSKRNLQS